MNKKEAPEMKSVRINCLGVCAIVLCILLITVSVLFNITYYKREDMEGIRLEKDLKNHNDIFNDPSVSGRSTVFDRKDTAFAERQR